jgi:hypothetical protein
MPTDVEVLKRLAAAGVSLSPEQIAAALSGPPALPEPGTVDPKDGRLRVTTEQIAPNSAWLRENRKAFNTALQAGKVDIVE